MIILARGRETVTLPPALWETLQELARQEGWRPVGSVDADGGCHHATYPPGRSVIARDARSLAKALERLVNSERLDGGEVDFAPLAQLVNFLRGGAFEIR
jgi:hypothetical protein